MNIYAPKMRSTTPNGKHIGHDEPSLLFYSSDAGRG